MYVVTKRYRTVIGCERTELMFLVPETDWHEFLRDYKVSLDIDDLPNLAQGTYEDETGGTITITAKRVPYYIAL